MTEFKFLKPQQKMDMLRAEVLRREEELFRHELLAPDPPPDSVAYERQETLRAEIEALSTQYDAVETEQQEFLAAQEAERAAAVAAEEEKMIGKRKSKSS